MAQIEFGFGTYRLRQKRDSCADKCPVYKTIYFSLVALHKYADKNIDIVLYHIDTAPSYGSEEGVGRAINRFISECMALREHIIVTTKISKPNLMSGTYADISKSIEHSLTIMNLDYIDEIIIHQPINHELSLINWIHLVEYKKNNPHKIRRIGVSNYSIDHLQQIIDAGLNVPQINQIELSPFLKRTELTKFCTLNSIDIVAHSPLAKGEKFNKTPIKNIADLNGMSEAQIMLQWAMKKGYRVIPRSSNLEHINENIQSYHFYKDTIIKDEDVLDTLEDIHRHTTHPQYL